MTPTHPHTAIGEVTIDLFHHIIPVFISTEAQMAVLKDNNIPMEPIEFPVLGAACRHRDENNSLFYSLIITPEATVGTWAHEAAHLTDYIFDQYSLSLGMKNTELRGHMIGNIVDQIDHIMDAWWEANPSHDEPEIIIDIQQDAVPEYYDVHPVDVTHITNDQKLDILYAEYQSRSNS